MAVSIRLKRLGRKKKAVYRVVVADKKNPRDGKTVEDIGFYNPLENPTLFTIKEDRLQYWISVGAKPTKTIERLLSNKSLIKKKKVTSSNQGVAKKDRKKAD